MNANERRRGCIIMGLWLLTLISLKAQSPLTISVFNESTTIPYSTFLNTPLHPGVQLGTEFEWKESKNFKVYPLINIGYMFHQKLFQGLYVNAELGVDYQPVSRVNIKSRLGVGYLRTYSTRQEYQLSNVSYESRRDKGNSRIMPSFTLGLGFNTQKENRYAPEVFVLYQSWIEYPYSPGFIPLMAHTSFHLGTKFYPSIKKSTR